MKTYKEYLHHIQAWPDELPRFVNYRGIQRDDIQALTPHENNSGRVYYNLYYWTSRKPEEEAEIIQAFYDNE